MPRPNLDSINQSVQLRIHHAETTSAHEVHRRSSNRRQFHECGIGWVHSRHRRYRRWLAVSAGPIRGNAVGWPVTDQVSTVRRRTWPPRRLGSLTNSRAWLNGSSRLSELSLNLGQLLVEHHGGCDSRREGPVP
jgi:hypothetical protein